MGDIFEEEFQEHVRFLNARGMTLMTFLGTIMVPLFSVLDYFVIHDRFWMLLWLRMGCSLVSGVLWYLSYTEIGKRYSGNLSVFAALEIGFTINLMIHLHNHDNDISSSQYYAGLNLVILASGLLYYWSTRRALVTYGAIYAMYIIPPFFYVDKVITADFISNNFFLVSTIAVVTAAQHFRIRLTRREFESSRSLEEANRRLTEMDRYKTRFFSNITHELKTPLTLILAPLEAILSEELGPVPRDQRAYLQGVHRNGLILMKLINDLLDLSRIEESSLRLRIEEVELSSYIEDRVSMVRPLAARKDIPVDLDLPRGGELRVWIDPDRFERVLLNLLANSIKFTEAGGRIVVAVEEVEGGVEIRVSDTGIGIPPDKLDFIFDRFAQVDSSSTRRYGGAGIGLALAKELVELHGGTIRVQSRVGEGTTMIVRLKKGRGHFAPEVLDRRTIRHPVSEARRADDNSMLEWSVEVERRSDYRLMDVDILTDRRLVPRVDTPRDLVAKRSRILVVDDHREVLQFVHMLLERKYHVLVADDGLKALEIVRKEKPDLVITDVMMPGIDGVELCSRIKRDEATSGIPVIMLTAKGTPEDRTEGRRAGADHYLAKPFSPSELLTIVDRVFEKMNRHVRRVVDRELDSMALLSGRLAHELNSALNNIGPSIQVMRRSAAEVVGLAISSEAGLSPEQLERLNKLRERIDRMAAMVSRGVGRMVEILRALKEYTREGYSKAGQDYDLDEGVAKALEMVRIPEGKEISLVHETSPEPCRIHCVPQELHEVVFNLVQNAIDAIEGRGTVTVRTERRGEVATLTVRDDGPGIPEQVQKKMFSPFFTTKEGSRGGLGLGLSIVRQLVRRMGGEIDVSSGPGAGAEFTVTLPMGPRG